MSIAHLLSPHEKDLGGFVARRSLPYPGRQMVGPFIFFDHLGPAKFPPGKGIDVRPHPHINLATVTYLFEGTIVHRDSLGCVQEICPGAVNWMTAGRGIVHSERSPEAARASSQTIHAIQTWLALPEEHEETDPCFHHYPAKEIPAWQENGVSITLIAGEFEGRTSPVKVFSPILYLDLTFEPNKSFTLPTGYGDRALYALSEGLTVDDQSLPKNHLAILDENKPVTIAATSSTRCIVIGGEPLGTRYKWWNFVSSRKERIEKAKRDWQNKKFPVVPEENERIPLPQEVREANPL